MATKKKVCRNCKMFTSEDVCPNCKRNSFTQNFQGKINFLNKDKSFIAKEMDVHAEGEFAIKIR